MTDKLSNSNNYMDKTCIRTDDYDSDSDSGEDYANGSGYSYISESFNNDLTDEEFIEEFRIPKSIKKGVGKTTKTVSKGASKTTKTVSKGASKATKAVSKGIGGGIDGILKGLKEILKLVRKIGPFFEKFLPLFTKLFPWIEKGFKAMIDFFKSWAKIGKFMTNPKKAIAAVLTLTIPVLGQVIARGMLYNGSMHLPWLMFFAIPPLTIVPMFAMMLGYIKPLQGGKPWDMVVWLPIMGLTLGSMIATDNKVMNVIKIVLGIGSFYLAYNYKSKQVCGDKDTTSKVALDAMNSYMIVIILCLIMPYIPFLGTFFSMVQAILPKSDLFLQAFAIFLVYVGTNIINGSFRSLCKTKVKDDALYGILLGAIALTFMVSFSPGDMASQLLAMKGKM